MTETYTVAEWETHPYTSHDKRSRTVYHRVRLLVYDEGTIDVVAQRKIPAIGSDEWTAVDVYEVRPSGVSHIDVHDGVMAE
jgi:hypothetical protein